MTVPDGIMVLAHIEFLPSAASGWTSAMFTGARPNHKFDDSSFRYIGAMDFADKREKLLPGESVDVFVSFLNSPQLEAMLVPGRVWEICAGPHQVIGRCELMEVVGAL